MGNGALPIGVTQGLLFWVNGCYLFVSAGVIWEVILEMGFQVTGMTYGPFKF